MTKWVTCPKCKGHSFEKPTATQMRDMNEREKAVVQAGYGQPICSLCEGSGEVETCSL